MQSKLSFNLKTCADWFFYICLTVWVSILALQCGQDVIGLEMLPLRDIDEFAFQEVLTFLEKQWQQQGVYEYFTAKFTSFGYGSTWWNIVHFSTKIFEPFSWRLAAPRFLSLGFSTWALIFLYRETKKQSAFLAFVFGLFYLSVSVLAEDSYRFHNHSFLFFLGMLCLVFTVFRKERSLVVAAAAGFATGTKISFLPVGVFFIALSLVSIPKLSFRKYAETAWIYFYSCLFAIAVPNVLLIPAFKTVPNFYEEVIAVMRRNAGGRSLQWQWEAMLTMLNNNYGLNIWASGGFALLFLTAAYWAIKNKNRVVGLAVLGVLGITFFLMMILNTIFGTTDAAHYGLPGSLIILASIIVFHQHLSKWGKRGLEAWILLLFLAVFTNANFIDGNFYLHISQWRKDRDAKKIELVEKAKKYMDVYKGKSKLLFHMDFPATYKYEPENGKQIMVPSFKQLDFSPDDHCVFLLFIEEDIPRFNLTLVIDNKSSGKFGFIKETCPGLAEN